MPTPTEDQMNAIRGLAGFNARAMRVPLMRSPADYDLPFTELEIPSYDQVPLKAWFIPAEGSDKLIVCNHPAPMNRYGFPGHEEPWNGISDFEVNFLPEYKILHEAGYNVLTYDLRNMGESGEGDGGSCGIGRYEWKDAVGVKAYIDADPVLSKMQIGLKIRCTGANAQFEAISRYPEMFANIKAIIAEQPVSMIYTATFFANAQGIGEFMDVLNDEQRRIGGFSNEDMSPHYFAHAVTQPILLAQVHEDIWTQAEDTETTFALLGSAEKELFWIEGTTRRFDGYNYFGQNPEKMLAFYAKYMK